MFCIVSLIVRIPDSVSFNEAAAIPVVGNTILKAFSALEANSKDALFISGGSGAIGTLAIQIAKQKGYKIIASASKRNHDYMKSLGADIVVDYNDHDWQDQVMSFIPEGVDTAIAINPNTSKEVSVIVKNNGTVIAVSGDQVELERGIELKQIPHMVNVINELEDVFKKVANKELHLTLQEYSFKEAIKVLEKVKKRHERGKSVLFVI